MPRYAIKQARALHTIYRDAPDALEAVRAARLALIDHAKHGELDIVRIADEPYDERDSESDARYEETDADQETERLRGLRMGLFGAERDSDALEPF